MADIGGPNLPLEIAKVDYDILQQRVNIAAQNVRKFQLLEELSRIEMNIAAAEKHIQELTPRRDAFQAQLAPPAN